MSDSRIKKKKASKDKRKHRFDRFQPFDLTDFEKDGYIRYRQLHATISEPAFWRYGWKLCIPDFPWWEDPLTIFNKRFKMEQINAKDAERGAGQKHPRQWFVTSLTWTINSRSWVYSTNAIQYRTLCHMNRTEKLIEQYENIISNAKCRLLVYKLAPDNDIANCILDFLPF